MKLLSNQIEFIDTFYNNSIKKFILYDIHNITMDLLEYYMRKHEKYKSRYIKLKNELSGGGRKRLSNIKSHKLNRMESQEFPQNIKLNMYEEHLSEPWFSLMSVGLKTIEGRKNKGRFKEMKIGDIIRWHNDDFGYRTFDTQIINKYEFNTFQEYLEQLGLNNCLPGINDLGLGLNVYYKYYTKEDEQKYGVVAIELKLLE